MLLPNSINFMHNKFSCNEDLFPIVTIILTSNSVVHLEIDSTDLMYRCVAFVRLSLITPGKKTIN